MARSILVVHENREVRECLAQIFACVGVMVHALPDGQNAYSFVDLLSEKERPSVVIISRELAEFDPSGFIGKLLQNPSEAVRKIPLIVFSAFPVKKIGGGEHDSSSEMACRLRSIANLVQLVGGFLSKSETNAVQ